MGTFDGDWESKINGVPEGIISINEPVAGLFLGIHQGSRAVVLGQAIEGSVPHMTFGRRFGGCAYVYDGDIRFVATGVAHFEIYHGTVTVICPQVDGRATAHLLSDDWTAEKPT